MQDFISLDLDPHFRDFNFCDILDPTLRPGSGPDESELYRLAYKARHGDRHAVTLYANTLGRTLRKETFECFQRVHGPRPISHGHWFYAKLDQFLCILLYEELFVYGLGVRGTKGPAC